MTFSYLLQFLDNFAVEIISLVFFNKFEIHIFLTLNFFLMIKNVSLFSFFYEITKTMEGFFQISFQHVFNI